jgi:hypothetical protein
MKTNAIRRGKDLEKIGANAHECILEMVTALQKANDDDDDDALEKARQAINEDPLSIEVRAGWLSLGESEPDNTPVEYRILLGTGGPAVRIVGELDIHGEARTATLQVQDWGTPWTDYHCDESTLLAYVQVFTFGGY